MDSDRDLLQQALEALDNCSSEYGHRCNRCDSEVDEGGKIVAALRARLAEPDPDYPCRSDGRCQYAIDSGAEGMGHCPKGKCVMPDDTDARVRRVMEAAVDYGVESLRVGSHERRCAFTNNGVADWQTVELRKKREAARAELERVVRETVR